MKTRLKNMHIENYNYTLDIKGGWMEMSGMYCTFDSLTEMLADMAKEQSDSYDRVFDSVLEEMTEKGANWSRVSAHCRSEIKKGVDLDGIFNWGGVADEPTCERYFETWEDAFRKSPKSYIGKNSIGNISDEMVNTVWENVCNYTDINCYNFIPESEKVLTDMLKDYFTFKSAEELSSLDRMYEDLRVVYDDYVEKKFPAAISGAIKELMQVKSK